MNPPNLSDLLKTAETLELNDSVAAHVVHDLVRRLRVLVDASRLVPRNMGCENSAMCEFTCGCEICKLQETLTEIGALESNEGGSDAGN